jgi:sigma-B regulation protein RsbU (phosphoserine phosphatase)
MSLWRILVVDDEEGMLRSVGRVLGANYEVASTRSSRDAVRLAEAFKPDLAILDIQMPEMDGFHLMEKLQALDVDLDVILMTGSIQELDAKLIRAIRKDAFYFLQKPFDRGVLLSLVERCLKLKTLDRTNQQHLLRIKKELDDARAFQQSLLPPTSAKLGGICISAHYEPCSELGGDFYDYVALPPDGAVIIVADVSGHGASAAMLTGIVKSALHSAGPELYEPASVAERVSQGIRAFVAHHFITLICTRIQNGRMDYVNAGHPPGILSTLGIPAVLLKATGPIISPVLDFSCEQNTIPVERGADRIVMYTDGIIEAESESGEFGLNRLIELASKRPVDGNLLSEQILQNVRQFTLGRMKDDLTLVIADL